MELRNVAKNKRNAALGFEGKLKMLKLLVASL